MSALQTLNSQLVDYITIAMVCTTSCYTRPSYSGYHCNIYYLVYRYTPSYRHKRAIYDMCAILRDVFSYLSSGQMEISPPIYSLLP